MHGANMKKTNLTVWAQPAMLTENIKGNGNVRQECKWEDNIKIALNRKDNRQ